MPIRIPALIVALLLACGLAVGPGAAPAAAQSDATLPEPARQAIRQVISAQIDAFRRDDGTSAYGFASPTIQTLFGSVDSFMAMVRQGFPPVYRPRGVAFGRLIAEPGRLVQIVRLIGPDGQPATARYSMEQQPDGSWKIAGCELIKEGLDV